MKTILMATTALAMSASVAMAADFPIYNPIAPAPAAYDWTGFYVGVNAGYGGGNFNYPVSIDLIVPDGFEDLDIDEQEEFLDDLPLGIGEGLDPETLEGGDVISLATGSADLTAGGFVGGLQAGYNFMASESILLGIEADIQASSISGTVTASIDTPVSTDLLSAGTDLNWYGTLRARAGMTHDRFLGYVTGGVAYGQTTSAISLLGTEIGSVENDLWGWTVGAGFEYAVTDQISLKTEYGYVDLGTAELVSGTLLGGGGGEGSIDGTLSSAVAFHTVRAGLNFHF
ncbi:Opacity protein [Devosia enhydra]|uniref:Opacity protein n=1 Tax=Devosia enhydra TaxID=665118 RepID=A0A1K2HSA8_9HYPH|nr:outer membrane beta-barrel protein [Devosia enhydra]SFZ80755.1 Opacity protein [Devosia enhydra]